MEPVIEAQADAVTITVSTRDVRELWLITTWRHDTHTLLPSRPGDSTACNSGCSTLIRVAKHIHQSVNMGDTHVM